MGRALVPYQFYTYGELFDILHSGQVSSIRDMAGRWRDLHRSLAERAEILKDGLDRLEEAWEGDASESYVSRMRKLENTIRVGADAAKANWNALEDAADGLEQAQLIMRPMGQTGQGTTAEGGGGGGGDIVASEKHALVGRLYDVDRGYRDAMDRLRSAPYDGPPPDADLDGDDGTGSTELASGGPGGGYGTPAGGVLGGGPGIAGGGAAAGGDAPARAGAVGVGGAAATDSAAGGARGAGRGGMPLGMGAGAGGGQNRKRKTWLLETDDVWGGNKEAAPRVLGHDPDDPRR